MDSRRSNSVDEAAKIREMHQSLLQDYLILQKECVSKKRKLKEAKEKKEILSDEIRFLKQRRNHLLNIKSQDSEQKQGVQSKKAQVNYDIGPSVRYASTSETTFHNPRPAIWNSGSDPKAEVGIALVKVGKNSKDVANGKRAGKRKISWQDQSALKV